VIVCIKVDHILFIGSKENSNGEDYLNNWSLLRDIWEASISGARGQTLMVSLNSAAVRHVMDVSAYRVPQRRILGTAFN
jgi:hypothetical protein